MGSAVVQLLLESVLAPFVLAGLTLIAARWAGQGRPGACVQAAAFLLAIGTTYVLAFGWPADLTFSARSKIMLSAIGGLIVGAVFEGRNRWARMALIAGAIGIPLWIGLPAMEQGRPDSALLILPIGIALAAPSLIDNPEFGSASSSSGMSEILIASTMAISLGVIAATAKAFSYTELCLALGSALFAALAIGRQQLAAPAAATVAATLLALATALLLYSEASLAALLILAATIGAKRLARLTSGEITGKNITARVAIFCALPAAAAILTARIDAGPFSIY